MDTFRDFVIVSSFLVIAIATSILAIQHTQQNEILKQIHTMDCNSMAPWKVPPIKAQKGDRK